LIKDGESSKSVKVNGKIYADTLLIPNLNAGHRTKAWRVLKKYSFMPTKSWLWSQFDGVHLVLVKNQGYGAYQALQYEGYMCVVQAPIQQPRMPSKHTVTSREVRLWSETFSGAHIPTMCPRLAFNKASRFSVQLYYCSISQHLCQSSTQRKEYFIAKLLKVAPPYSQDFQMDISQRAH
jgi:hypothetical protein